MNPCGDDYLSRYQCINGRCTVAASFCASRSFQCTGFRAYYCPDEKRCVVSDIDCLRPCGFQQGGLHYDVRCLGSTLCAMEPGACDDCRSGLRCLNDQSCYTSEEHCNGFYFCSDGSDEFGCPEVVSDSYVETGPSNFSLGLIIGIPVFVVILVVTVIVSAILCKRQRHLGSVVRARPTPQQGVGGHAAGPLLAGARPAAPTIQMRDQNPYQAVHPPSGSSAYQTCPQHAAPPIVGVVPSAPPASLVDPAPTAPLVDPTPPYPPLAGTSGSRAPDTTLPPSYDDVMGPDHMV